MARDDGRRGKRPGSGRVVQPEPTGTDATPAELPAADPAPAAIDETHQAAPDVSYPHTLDAAPVEAEPREASDFAEPATAVEPPTPRIVSPIEDTATGAEADRPIADGLGASEAETGDRAEDTVGRSEDKSRPSIMPALAALVLAILAAGWIYLYNQVSATQSDGRAQVADLQGRIGALEARPVPDIDAVTKRVDLLSTQTDQRLAALSRRLDELPAGGGDTRRIAAIEAQQGDLKKQLDALQATVAALPKPDFTHVDQRLTELDQRLGALQGTVAAIPRIDLGPLTGRVDALDARLKPVETDAEAARSPQRVAERRAAPVAVTAQAISEAIDAGQSFPRELAALQVLGVAADKLAPLQSVAASGAPALRDLQASLAELRDRMVAQGTPKPSGSYVDRLMSGASALVQVRPTGSVVGDTPAAIIARMNDEIGSDDLARALHEWESLPSDSRSVSRGLADRLRIRLEAENAAKAIAASAIDTMAPRG